MFNFEKHKTQNMIGYLFFKATSSALSVASFVYLSYGMHDGFFNSEISQTDYKFIAVSILTSIISIVMEYNDNNKKNPKLSIVFITPIISFSFVWLTYEYALENNYAISIALIASFIIGLLSLEIIRFLFSAEAKRKLRMRLSSLFDKRNTNDHGAIE